MSPLLTFLALFAIFLLSNVTNGFLGNRFHDNEDSNKFGKTYTHRDITKEGLQRAALTFIKKKFNAAVKSIGEHFGEDHQARKKFDVVVDSVIAGGSYISQHMNKTAHYHMMGEQVKLGHNHLRWLRNRITTLSTSSKPDYSFIRKLIGQYLYTMQTFYSNTNWIEDQGKKIYTNLGMTEDIFAVAKTNVSMCKACDDSEKKVKADSCKANMIKKKPFILTSCYKYGQDMHKPLGFLSETSGKCSYGGKYDGNSTKIPAKGGMNKDTASAAYSPHYKLHADAAEIAIQATEYFLIDESNGLLGSLGLNTMQKILQIWPKGPIIFIVDVTYGMDTHYKTVKGPLTKNLENLLAEYKPSTYIVANITDKADTSGDNNVQGANVTTDVGDAVKWLKALPAIGGGDDHEYPFTAIEKTLKKSEAGKLAKVFVFTDNGAHDRNMSDNVTKLAKSIGAKIDFIYFGSIQERRRRDVSQLIAEENTGESNAPLIRHRRGSEPEFNFYRNLSDWTGGIAFPASKNDIGEILEVIETEFWPNAHVGVQHMESTTSCDLSFPVDNYLRYLRIEMNGVAAGKAIVLKDHKGNLLDSKKNSKVSKIYLGGKKHIVQVKEPSAGKFWVVQPASTTSCNITITGHSGLDFSYFFVKNEAGAFSYKTTESPVTGVAYTLVVSVNNLKDGKVNSIIIKTSNGGTIITASAKKLNSTSESLFHAKVVIPNKTFIVTIEGVDSRGALFRRTSSSKIQPSDVTFSLLPYHGDLAQGQDMKLTYKLKNWGDGAEYRVDIKNNRKIKISPDSVSFDLSKGQSVTKEFWITGKANNDIVTVTFTVKKGSIVQQTHKEMFWTTASGLPSCVVKSKGSCNNNVMFTKNCSSKSWKAKVTATVRSGKIKAYFASNADSYNVKVKQDKSVGQDSDYSITGSCCNPIVYFTIVDGNGGWAQCKLEQAGGKTLHYTIVPPTTASVLTDMEVLIIATAVPVGFLLLIVVLILAIWCRVKKKGSDNEFDLSFEYK